MSEQTKNSEENPLGGIAVVIGIICAIAGYSDGGWPVAIGTFFLGYGSVFLAAKILGVFLGWLVTGGVLLVLVAIFLSRWEKIAALFQ